MTKFRTLAWALLAHLMIALPAHAQQAATIADLAWLEGRWTGTGVGGAPTGESWSFAGEQMVGHFWQLADDGSAMFYELITIVPDGSGGLTMRLKHFGGDLTGWEGQAGDTAAEFPLTMFSADQAQFSGITYARDGADRLTIAVQIHAADGTRQMLTFAMQRAGD